MRGKRIVLYDFSCRACHFADIVAEIAGGADHAFPVVLIYNNGGCFAVLGNTEFFLRHQTHGGA